VLFAASASQLFTDVKHGKAAPKETVTKRDLAAVLKG